MGWAAKVGGRSEGTRGTKARGGSFSTNLGRAAGRCECAEELGQRSVQTRALEQWFPKTFLASAISRGHVMGSSLGLLGGGRWQRLGCVWWFENSPPDVALPRPPPRKVRSTAARGASVQSLDIWEPYISAYFIFQWQCTCNIICICLRCTAEWPDNHALY